MSVAGKDQRKIITAVERELLGFIWAIAVKAEQAFHSQLLHERQRQKPFQAGKSKTLNNAIQLEDKISRSRGKHEGEPSAPANISLINRRHYLPRLLLILSSFEKDDQRTLTGHYISTSG